MNEKHSLMRVISKSFDAILRTSKYLVFLVNIVFLILLSSSFLVWNISPAETPYLAYLGLAFGFILFINFIFILLWLFTRSWFFLASNILVFIICHNPILSFFPLHFFAKAEPSTGGGFKVLSYNVRGFNRKIDKPWSSNPIVVYMQNQNADIICIQEYLASTDSDNATSEKLSKVLNMPYYRVTALRNVGSYVYGLAIFSKYPIKNAEKLPLETTDNGSVLYYIEINGKTISLINNHLESNRLTLKDKQLYASLFKERRKESLGEVKHNIENRLGKAYSKRAPQAELVANFVNNQTTDATIVCGDFNDTPISYTYHTIISADLTDSYMVNAFGPGITYHENYFWFRIDFILHSKNIVSSNFRIGKVRYSDHYPISTYIRFKQD